MVRLGGPARLLEPASPVAGYAALAISIQHGDPGSSGEPGDDPCLVYAGCQRALRPGGVLAVVTASTITSGRLRDDPGEAVTLARATGLVYTQHIVAVHALIHESQMTPGPETAALRAARAGGTQPTILSESGRHAEISDGKPRGSQLMQPARSFSFASASARKQERKESGQRGHEVIEASARVTSGSSTVSP